MTEITTIQGVMERLLFEAPDSDYLVFRLRLESDDLLLTVTGHGSKPLVGDRLRICGEWVQHKRFGKQFAASGWQRLAPETADGIESFLASGAVDGIGPALAHRIVAAFGMAAMDIMEREPDRLLEIDGIGRKKLAVITESFRAEKEVNGVALLLEEHGVTGRYASRLVQKYGDDAAYVLAHEPYRLIQEIDGIGFKTADQIALAFGMEPFAEERLAAGMTYILQELNRSGHVCVPATTLTERSAAVLHADEGLLHDAAARAVQWGQLVTADYGGTMYVYTAAAYEAETLVAERIREMTAMKPLPVRTHVSLFLDRRQDTRRIVLAEKQREAVERSLSSGLLVITGGPGTGKTTVVQTIIQLAEQEGLKIVLCAPTGRAAKRLSETTGRQGQTIHRLLCPAGYVGSRQVFEYNETHLLKADLVIVDEVSMLDLELMDNLLRALPPYCRCILVGDADQLPSVGAGAVLHDIIRSETVPVIRLETIFRQHDGGRIVTNAHRINRGQLPIVNEDDEFRFVEIKEEKAGAEQISALYAAESAEHDGVFAVQVLSPMYRQECGVDQLNRLIQERCNGPAPGKGEIRETKAVYRIGDKVMQKQNNYDKGVFNGDIGVIFAVQQERIHVRYPEQDVKYEGREIDEITLAYAITVHKSQGSEYHTVIMALTDSHAIMLQRNLFYTAVTRAKRKVILVGTKGALHRAVANVRQRRRFTLLAERLRGEEIL